MSYRKFTLTAAAILLLAATIALGFAPAGADPARQESATRIITVTGYGIAYGAPDIAYLNLGVEVANADITAALSDASARMERALAALKQAGVAPEDIRTTMYSVYQETPPYPVLLEMPESSAAPQPGLAEPAAPSAPIYHVSTSVEVTVRDTDKIGSLLAAAIESGANAVSGIRFDIADRAALEADARTAAVADARARAEQLANTLGVTLGDVIEVVEGSGYAPVYGGGLDVYAAAAVPPISEGTLSVSVALTITFAIQ